MTTETLPLYDRLGGVEPLTLVVDDFYRRVLADEHLSPFFVGVNVARLQGRQVEFLASALGGPPLYAGPSMAQVHAGRGIESRHFAAVAGHLVASLETAGVEPALIGEVVGVVAGLEPDIVGTPS